MPNAVVVVIEAGRRHSNQRHLTVDCRAIQRDVIVSFLLAMILAVSLQWRRHSSYSMIEILHREILT